MTGRVTLIALGAVAVWLTATGYGWIVFTVLSSACATMIGVAVWHLFSPERQRAHQNYRARVARRPKPATQWAMPAPELPANVRPARPDIQPNPGRRMVALIPDDEPARQ